HSKENKNGCRGHHIAEKGGQCLEAALQTPRSSMLLESMCMCTPRPCESAHGFHCGKSTCKELQTGSTALSPWAKNHMDETSKAHAHEKGKCQQNTIMHSTAWLPTKASPIAESASEEIVCSELISLSLCLNQGRKQMPVSAAPNVLTTCAQLRNRGSACGKSRSRSLNCSPHREEAAKTWEL
ncbi:hypothetical protein P4O66_016288, partial [Electrophorus voltai]